ncbi:NAD(P)-binding domain-containing protein [Acuticoccus sp. M5D2P5]|uniref:NAD(P)-dependent oxidoreductase n=1 Tax=Acuticoccus kalidii TaxID=2910977 RepID=UPI001F3D41F9|nr:NAD(P)-dependent oxidoreductase [Acuticoccus kalidii]MCF3936194.1 NAD(P)-binding domain-containing protein [Acuticoccus kalidii]
MTDYVLVCVDAAPYVSRLADICNIVDARRSIAAVDETVRARAEIIVTSGLRGITREEIALLPSLKMISCIGTGFDAVDIEAAAERGIFVTHAAGANAKAVADHAMGLLLAVVRAIPAYDAGARKGGWRELMPERSMIGDKRIGLVGMGGIGQALARRAAGFDMEIAYHATAPKPDLPWRYVDNVVDLARDVDCLIASVPGGSATYHMIGRDVFEALGPNGFFVNVGRGSVTDTEALIDALRNGTIAGAGLDVFENEPGIPKALLDVPNLVVTPHVGGVALEAQDEAAARLLASVTALLAGNQPPGIIPPLRARFEKSAA